MIAEVSERFAEAPVGPGLTAEGHDAAGHRLDGVVGRDGDGQGLAKAAPIAAVCGVLPPTGVEGEALALEGADVDGRVERLAALVGGDRPWTAVPAPMAGLPGKRAMVWVGPP